MGRRLAVTGFLVLSVASTARGEVIFEHTGSTDPVTEGWTVSIGVDVEMGPTPDGLAWYVDDPSEADGSGGGHLQTLTQCQAATIGEFGWTMRGCLRIDDPDEQASLWFGFNTSVRRFDMWFSSNADGEPIIELMTSNPAGCGISGPSFTLTDGGSPCLGDAYHLYELVFDPQSQTADLFVDGIERISDYAGHTIGLGQYAGVGWGAGSNCADGYAEFQLVQFEANGPPPPATDINCDGFVNVHDLLLLLDAWGPCAGCAEDVDASGEVDVTDLLVLLREWGAAWS